MTHFSAAKRRPRNPWDRQALGVPNFSLIAASKRPWLCSRKACLRSSLRVPRECLHGRDDRAPLFRAAARFEKSGRVHRPRMTHFSAAKRRPRNPWVEICEALGCPRLSCKAAFLLDTMAALPRKWVSGGLRLVAYASESAPTLPRQTIALTRRCA
jgi:hypothetical protein